MNQMLAARLHKISLRSRVKVVEHRVVGIELVMLKVSQDMFAGRLPATGQATGVVCRPLDGVPPSRTALFAPPLILSGHGLRKSK